MMIMCPWVCYLAAEGLQLSGIVAICTNGVFLGYYAKPNVTRDSRRVLRLSYETIAVTAEQIVFLFLGIGLFAFNHPFEKLGIGLTITTILNLNFARFLNILIVTKLVNCSRMTTKISGKMQFVMWLSGLRGAMAYALALKCATDLEIGPVILIDTLIYALITILGIGSILNPVLSKLEVKRKEEDASSNSSFENPYAEGAADSSGAGVSDGGQKRGCCANYLKSRVKSMDRRFMQPVFVT